MMSIRFRPLIPSVFSFLVLASTVFAVEIPDHLMKVDPGVLNLSVHKSVPPEKASKALSPKAAESLGELSLSLKSFHKNSPKFEKPLVPPSITSHLVNGTRYVDAIVKLDSPEADIEPILETGAIFQSRYGEFLYVDLPEHGIARVAELPQVLAISGCHPPSPFNDTATQDTGVTTVWNTMGLRGEGVVVGVVDSGVDWRHQDFKNNDGATRILGIWDQYGQGGTPPAGFTYGIGYTSANINAGNCAEQDEESAGGHGTHVTGTAAGNGRGTGNGQPAGRFEGVANRAEIVFCKYQGEQTMVDALNYCFNAAQSAGKPIAVNLSQGWVFGPHDGTTLVEQNLNAITGPEVRGKIVVFAAANSGGQSIYAHSDALPGPSGDQYPYLSFGFYNRTGPKGGGVEVYYNPGSSLRARVVYSKNGTAYPVTDWIAFGNNTGSQQISSGPLQSLPYEASNAAYANGLGNWNVFKFDVVDRTGAGGVEGSTFIIQLDGAGTAINAWHSWRDFGRFFNANDGLPADPLRIDGNDTHTLGYPGSMTNAICVASYVTRTQWTDLDGTIQTQQGAVLGEISSFSSKGPRVDGLDKPDIAAPGEALLSTLASTLTQVSRSSIERDGVHQKMQGTSMAAPVVTGFVALMLQKNPNLNVQEARDFIRNHARDAGATGWDPIWGAGKLDCPAVINAMGGANPTPVPTNTLPANLPTATSTPIPQNTPTPTTGPPPQELIVNSYDTPMVIPSNWFTLSSVIKVDSYQADQVTVNVDVTHHDLTQLFATVSGPNGIWIYLNNTEQNQPIFPEQDVQGTWMLQILDFSGVGGVLNGWSLSFSSGSSINCGETISGSIDADDEDLFINGTRVDMYTFSLPLMTDVTVRMSAAGFTSNVGVFSEVGGRPFGYALFSDLAEGFGLEAIASTPMLFAGDYVIVANNFEPVSQYPQPYQLTLECGGIAAPTATFTPIPAVNTATPTNTTPPLATATRTATQPGAQATPTPMTTRFADLNEDHTVDVDDVLILLKQWHETQPE